MPFALPPWAGPGGKREGGAPPPPRGTCPGWRAGRGAAAPPRGRPPGWWPPTRPRQSGGILFLGPPRGWGDNGFGSRKSAPAGALLPHFRKEPRSPDPIPPPARPRRRAWGTPIRIRALGGPAIRGGARTGAGDLGVWPEAMAMAGPALSLFSVPGSTATFVGKSRPQASCHAGQRMPDARGQALGAGLGGHTPVAGAPPPRSGATLEKKGRGNLIFGETQKIKKKL